MIHEFHYSLTEIENMMPWEREIFSFMIMARLNEQQQENNNG